MGFAVAGVMAAGALAGSQKDQSGGYSTNASTSSVDLRDFADLNKGSSGLENLGYNSSMGNFQDLMKLVQAGPGEAEVTANTQYQNSFANNLQGFLNQIQNPTQASISKNFGQAKTLFAPQQTALNQQFTDQNIASSRLAAKLGRAGNDPVLRNELMKEQTRQQTTLNSQIGSYGMQLPQIQANNYANLGGMLSNLRSGLASQALQNRSTLLSMGQNLAASERNYRLSAAGKSTYGSSSGQNYSGGGLKGAMMGGLAGFGASAGLMGGGDGMESELGSDGAQATSSGVRPTGGTQYLSSGGY